MEVPLGHEKRAPQRPLSSFALQRYNKTRRKANRRRRTQNGKIRKKGKWRRVVVPCPLTWHSVLVAAPAATPFLCRRNAAVPGMSRCKCNSCKRRHRPRWARVQKVHLRIARAPASTNTFALTARRGLWRPYPGRRSLWSLARGLLCCNPNNWTIFFTLTAVFHCFLVLLPLEEGI